MSLKKEISKVEYRIKLLSGNNVVLVEANGFESEIFVPSIHNGRISFQNIIPNRRCCNRLNVLASKSSAGKKRRSTQTTERILAPVNYNRDSISPSTTWRLQAGHEVNRTRSPLAFSTPAPAPSPSPSPSYTIGQQLKHHNKENYTPLPRALAQANHPIDILRVNRRSPIQLNRKSSLQTPDTRTVRIQCQQSEISKHLNAASGDSGSGFNIPDVPNLSRSTGFSFLESPNNAKSKAKKANTSAPGTVTKWRKCLTPVRTYSRNGFTVPRLPSSSSVTNARNLKRLPSMTQGTKGTYKLEVRRRKLVVDPKTAISPNTFKQQQRTTAHLRPKSPNKRRSGATLPNDRRQYDMSKKTAFDMLTAPSRSHVATKLAQQFKKACVNKASSTCPKYKILCKIPPLEQPERQPKGKYSVNKYLPPSNITAAAMMEKACSTVNQTCEGVTHFQRPSWPTQTQ
ncbi:PREDICTED: uncharacterized protein LOC108363895 [Rhagoletis zephyria]|uniref:uncharacterized protein LOC108363895 n=1 Tax=Rhagoletis zephyria TaxID=28612 RepID=UPI0008118D98|nr:PREDICTED: uncharacterized protein LOC108363895 [Rhagoletis zephyria]